MLPSGSLTQLSSEDVSLLSRFGPLLQALVLGSGEYFLRTSVYVSSDGPMMTGVRTGFPSTWR